MMRKSNRVRYLTEKETSTPGAEGRRIPLAWLPLQPWQDAEEASAEMEGASLAFAGDAAELHSVASRLVTVARRRLEV